ncbi:FHA domain-containing protein [Agromyces arachidis]|uniref:FHA domain-containing protein n=1 Tax=Agromyces arachidis TaxID=766966 RepID=UPI004056D06F
MADYRPDPTGGWLAALRAGALLLLPADRSADLAALWPGFEGPEVAARVIDRLIAGGVSSAPGFALVVREPDEGSVRVVVRGPLTVRVGGEAIDGRSAATWNERVLSGPASVVVAVDEAAAAAGGTDAMLPIVEGVVAASVVEWPDGAVGAQAMAPVEDTVVGFSRTERPRIESPAAHRDGPTDVAGSPAVRSAVSTTTIVPPRDVGEEAPLGDHDGLTVAAADLRRLRGDGSSAQSAAGDRPGAPSQDRLALRMPDGSFEPITGELLLGRSPAIGRVAGRRVPRPVVIGAGDPDISRTHVRVADEGGTAVVTDLASRNGTSVVAPGQPPMRLRPSEPMPVLPETVIDLGGGWSVQVVVR